MNWSESFIATAAPLLMDNVDTDQIIPSREMKTISKKGNTDTRTPSTGTTTPLSVKQSSGPGGRRAYWPSPAPCGGGRATWAWGV